LPSGSGRVWKSPGRSVSSPQEFLVMRRLGLGWLGKNLTLSPLCSFFKRFSFFGILFVVLRGSQRSGRFFFRQRPKRSNTSTPPYQLPSLASEGLSFRRGPYGSESSSPLVAAGVFLVFFFFFFWTFFSRLAFRRSLDLLSYHLQRHLPLSANQPLLEGNRYFQIFAPTAFPASLRWGHRVLPFCPFRPVRASPPSAFFS